jgi:hypothetical protein
MRPRRSRARRTLPSRCGRGFGERSVGANLRSTPSPNLLPQREGKFVSCQRQSFGRLRLFPSYVAPAGQVRALARGCYRSPACRYDNAKVSDTAGGWGERPMPVACPTPQGRIRVPLMIRPRVIPVSRAAPAAAYRPCADQARSLSTQFADHRICAAGSADVLAPGHSAMLTSRPDRPRNAGGASETVSTKRPTTGTVA